jgi:hypothetical protein
MQSLLMAKKEFKNTWRRDGLPGVFFNPPDIRVICRPTVAMTQFMPSHQRHNAAVANVAYNGDVAYGLLVFPRAGRTMAQRLDLWSRQSLLNHLAVVRVIKLCRWHRH